MAGGSRSRARGDAISSNMVDPRGTPWTPAFAGVTGHLFKVDRWGWQVGRHSRERGNPEPWRDLPRIMVGPRGTPWTPAFAGVTDVSLELDRNWRSNGKTLPNRQLQP
jgi:hypothetical protein